MPDPLVLGCGSAYADDWLEPAVEIAQTGRADYLAFDCLAERTMALAQVRRMADPHTGQDQRIGRITELFGGYLSGGGRIIGSFGAANPDAAAAEVIAGLRGQDIGGLRVGVVRGDDVMEAVIDEDLELPEIHSTAKAEAHRIVSANAYIGAEPIVELLEQGAGFILGGRLADPSLYVAPIAHELGWDLDDWHRMGLATLAGHLLECGVHGAGGNFEDPPYRTVPEPWRLGSPMAEMSAGGDIVITKPPGTGGAIDGRTVRAQLLYEIHDPATYLTPDVTADFSEVTIEEIGPDRVRVAGATGRARPDTLKVLVGIDLGFKAVAEASIGGPGCLDRARRGEEIYRHRIEQFGDDVDELRIDLHGLTSLFGDQRPSIREPVEVRMRVAARCRTRETATALARELEFLYFGPAGFGGISHSVVPAIAVTPALLSRDRIDLETELMSS